MIAPSPPNAPFGIYLHIPFCGRICPYCDFNRYIHQEHLMPSYVDALIGEMDLTRAKHGPLRAETIFFGGGTPSLLEPAQVAQIIDGLRQHFAIDPDAEVTLEANPERLDAAKLVGFRAAGINRISLGVQTQQPHGLRVLGRAHKPEVPERALRQARAAGFDNLSLDFIFGWPGQTLDDWRSDLQTMLEWQPEHLSLYSLIVEPGTPYHEAVRTGKLIPVDDDTTADMYEMAIEQLGNAGWQQYEVSNWAREPGLESRHNAIYWRNGQYLGLGAGAHGHIDGIRASKLRLPTKYIASVNAGKLPIDFSETIDAPTAMAETMMLGLRLLQDGVSEPAFAERHGHPLREVYGAQISSLEQLNLLHWDGDRLKLTHRGLLLANDVAERFLPEALPVRA
ncbi:MAG TPA: radical SAM family heme chaperone HemW [Nitrolancea sp.]|nr:radical SAM family heme chaperone HemW [Nitrolancea sp.]